MFSHIQKPFRAPSIGLNGQGSAGASAGVIQGARAGLSTPNTTTTTTSSIPSSLTAPKVVTKERTHITWDLGLAKVKVIQR